MIAFVQLAVAINAACIIDWFNSFVKNAENDVNDNWSQVNPEQVFECFSSSKVKEWILHSSSGEEVGPAEQSVKDGHVGNEFPIIFFQNAVCYDCVHCVARKKS